MKPLCFVLMPFGKKKDSHGREVDFDAVYNALIAPAVAAANMIPVRADEEQVGGTIHKPMFERLMLCEYAVADVTGANPNVYYELGVRHALRPRSTVILFAEDTPLPFDVAPLRGLAYAVDRKGRVRDIDTEVKSLTAALKAAKAEVADDSPLFQLIDDMPRFEIDHTKTDVFREQVAYSEAYKERLAVARENGKDAVLAIAAEPDLADLMDVEAGIVIDLFLSLRGVKAFGEMIALYDRMPLPLQRAKLVREQLAFALNRVGRGDEAERVLLDVLKKYKASTETSGLLGRIYKDRWEEAVGKGQKVEAAGLLKKAIEIYAAGFEVDWRDAYPGVNAVTLMDVQGKGDPRLARLLPVVRYAAGRRADAGGDYWDHATLVEIAVLERDRETAETQLETAMPLVRDAFEPETTARNLRLIADARRTRDEETSWVDEIISALEAKHAELVGEGQP